MRPDPDPVFIIRSDPSPVFKIRPQLGKHALTSDSPSKYSLWDRKKYLSICFHFLFHMEQGNCLKERKIIKDE